MKNRDQNLFSAEDLEQPKKRKKRGKSSGYNHGIRLYEKGLKKIEEKERRFLQAMLQ